jgi:hypothetical protein
MEYTEYFSASNLPEESCDKHVLVTVCKNSGMLAGAYCPEIVTRACIVGAESGSADATYSAPSSMCTLHDENYRAEEEEGDGTDIEDDDIGEPDDGDEEPLNEREENPALAVTAMWTVYFLRRRRK